MSLTEAERGYLDALAALRERPWVGQYLIDYLASLEKLKRAIETEGATC